MKIVELKRRSRTFHQIFWRWGKSDGSTLSMSITIIFLAYFTNGENHRMSALLLKRPITKKITKVPS